MENNITVNIYYSGHNFSAFVPLLPGCVATGATPKEINQHIKEAVELHVKSSLEDGDEIPQVFRQAYELDYHFDTKGLLNYYKGIFTKTALVLIQNNCAITPQAQKSRARRRLKN